LNAASLLLDDFNTASDRNKFGGITGAWADTTARSKARFSYDPEIILGRTGYSLKLRYETFQENYCGYYSKLNGYDLSAYNYVSFWVKGEVGGEFVKLELKNIAAQVSKSYLNDHLDGPITTQWQKVVIPLDTFIKITDWTSMDEFIIANVWKESLTNGSQTSGTIYIDDIVFGTWDPGYVRLDYYADNHYFNSFHGNTGSGFGGVGASLTASLDSSEYYSGPNSLKLEYRVNPGFIYFFNLFGEPASQTDLSRYSYISFWCKSTNSNIEGNGSSRGLKVEMATNDPSAPFFFKHTSTITNYWKKFSIPLSEIKSNGTGPIIDASKIIKLTFVLADNLLVPDRTGTVYIDNVQFETASYAPDTTKPTTPTLLKSGNEEIFDGYSFDQYNTLTVTADSGAVDASLEGIFFEYSLDDSATWGRIDADWDSTDGIYSVIWNTSDIAEKSMVKLRVYTMDASGNISDYLTSESGYVVKESELKKPDQKIVTPNGDGVNDKLLFLGLKENFEISIYSLKGVLIKKITDENYWDGKDKDGDAVESGPYIYQAKYGGDMISGTVLIVK